MHPLEQPRKPQNQCELNQSPPPTGARDAARAEPSTMRKSSVSVKSKPPVSSHNGKSTASAAVANSKRDSQDSLFLDNEYPSDGERPEFDRNSVHPPRDSHDLSLPSKNFTRDSLLGNMLNSLDQFSLSQINTQIAPTFEEEDAENDPYGVPRGDTFTRSITNTSHVSRSIHEHAYSLGSEFDASEDGSKTSSQFFPHHRSDRSSNTQSGLPAGMAVHARGKSSTSTNSFDLGGGFAQVSPTQGLEYLDGGRSSSLDFGQRLFLDSPGPWETDFPSALLVDPYDVAPTPTVPSGPGGPSSSRRSAAPPTNVSEYESQTERKKDSRSRSGTNKTAQSKQGTTREATPLSPPSDASLAPAPQLSYGKSKDAQQAGPTSALPAKEKQGFFSRWFGSARLMANPVVEPVVTPAPSVIEEPLQQVMSESKTLSAPPTRDSDPSRQMPHVIQKKSSFFRRRKKSNPEPPVPPLPLTLAPPIELSKGMNTAVSTAEPSPSSSIRETMTPQMKSGIRSSTNPIPDSTAQSAEMESNAEKNRKDRGFSPEYEPSPSATIRTVKSTSALKNKDSRWLSQPDSPMQNPPNIPTKFTHNADSTFFHDSSDEGERVLDSVPKQRQSHAGKMSSQKSKMSSLSSGFDTPKSGEYDPTQAIPEDPIESIETPMSRSIMSRSVSNVPSVIVDGSRASPRVPSGPLDELEVTVGEPTEDDCQKAQAIFDGDEDFISKEKAASWMGEEGLVRQRTLRAYMDLYDFENQSVLAALRQVCTRLVFRAETQQVDRILVAFSNRWCTCNPNHGFKTIDVIHTMCYSIMLLNTDLHLADIEQKMTKNQFIKNTMSTITEPFENLEEFNQSGAQSKNALLSPATTEFRTLAEGEPDKTSWRASFKPLPRSESSQGFHNDWAAAVDTCGPLVKAPFEGPLRAWEGQIETVLKEIYNSIRDEKLPLFGANPTYPQAQSHGNLTMMSKLRRSPSVLSKAPSESHAYSRGRLNDANRIQGNRWMSKSRSRPRLPNGFSSSRTSFEDNNSIWSPATSSATWSRQSLGRTQTSLSVDSFSSGYPSGDYQQSIGFANALSQAITRDDYPVGNSSQSIMSEDFKTTQLLDDESLELLGPPWVKEGIVTHKHHLDGVDKKAKDRNWNEVFAVVQKGTLSIFSFSTKSTRQKARVGRKPAAGAVVGGGNWQENATSLGSFSLRHTLASALPAPGYSRTRPHVWALSLPSGAVHLFQVGTPEISKEFILTVNYWSARLSTHPLIGGISNVEYGWSDAAINSALIGSNEDSAEQRPSSATTARASSHSRQGSRQSSLRSSFDIGGGLRSRLPGDRIHIADWSPPSQSLRPSQCSESEQLGTLQGYVNSVENEFQQHNQLRSPMLLAFTPRGLNAVKSMANWERKSSYLLREIVKFRTYVDSLQHASERRKEIYTERENARRAARGEDIDDSASTCSREVDVTEKKE